MSSPRLRRTLAKLEGHDDWEFQIIKERIVDLSFLSSAQSFQKFNSLVSEILRLKNQAVFVDECENRASENVRAATRVIVDLRLTELARGLQLVDCVWIATRATMSPLNHSHFVDNNQVMVASLEKLQTEELRKWADAYGIQGARSREQLLKALVRFFSCDFTAVSFDCILQVG